VWSSGRRGEEQHEKEGDKEAKQLESNYKT
jgi:hypothetical protein